VMPDTGGAVVVAGARLSGVQKYCLPPTAPNSI